MVYRLFTWLVNKVTMSLVVCQLSCDVIGCEDCITWLVLFDLSLLVKCPLVLIVSKTIFNWLVYSGHLIGCGKKSKIMREFSGILCGKICWLCGNHAGLCRNLLINNVEIDKSAFPMFCCYVNCLVRILLLRLFEDKFIHTSDCRWIFWEAERAKEDKVFKLN